MDKPVTPPTWGPPPPCKQALRWTANGPVKKLTNGMDLSWILDEEWGVYNVTFEGKRNLFFSPSKEKGKEDARSQVNLYNA